MIGRALIFLLLTVIPLADAKLTITCRDGDSFNLPTNLEGVYFQVNNSAWNDPYGNHNQCVSGGSGGLGWRWDKPRFTYQPYFPNVELNVTQMMHVNATQFRALEVILIAVVNANGNYNLAFDIWFTADRGGKQVTDEVMVWLIWTNREFRLPKAVNDGFNDYGYITFKAAWRFHAFILLANKIPFHVDLLRLITFAGVDGYLRSISLGNEVFSGTGRTKVYAINIMVNELSIRNAGACYSPSCADSYSP